MTNAESDPYDFNLPKEKVIDGEENIKTKDSKDLGSGFDSDIPVVELNVSTVNIRSEDEENNNFSIRQQLQYRWR
jgi:hypothetical protein